MPIIKPVSDLRNYPTVLKDVTPGHPVFLTKNGKGRYVLISMDDYDRLQAADLYSELLKGELAGEKEGWLTHAEVFPASEVSDDQSQVL